MWLSDTLLLMYNVYYVYQFESCIYEEEFGDTKGVIRIHISKKNRQRWSKEKVQKDKQRSTKLTQ